MKLPDAWSRATPIFDDDNLVSFAGLAPVMALAERAGLSELIAAASGLWTREAGRQLRPHQDRRQADPAQGPVPALVTTISTETGAPVVAGIRLRAGRAGSGKGAATMVADAIRTARSAGATGEVLVRGDSAYGSRAVITACVAAGARFSLALTKNPAAARAISSIREDAWAPVHYPGAVTDPDTGQLISDAEVAEIEFTAIAST